MSSRRCAGVEFRGAWVTSWSPGFYTPEEIDRTIEDAKTAGLNALVVEVRKAGDAYYQSDIEPVGREVPVGFDPLAYAVEKGHAEGMEIHAWLVVYRVWKGSEMPSDLKHVLNLHPDWVNVSYDGSKEGPEGVYLDPGVPEYRDYFASICADIAKRYDIDSIHFDYIRYPEKEWGYSEIALSRYYAETGETVKPEPDDPKWQQWKRDQVTAMVKLVRDRVKAVKPYVKIQASTIPWHNCPEDFRDSAAYKIVCQDWRLWMEEGLIDENCPMVYAREWEESGARHYRDWIEGAKRWSYGRPVYIGTSAGFNNPEQILQQIEAVRHAGLPGFVLFAFNQTEDRPEKAKKLGEGLYPAPRLFCCKP